MEEEKISMEIVNPHAAGIDVGSRSHWLFREQLIEKDVIMSLFKTFNETLMQLGFLPMKAKWLTRVLLKPRASAIAGKKKSILKRRS